MKINGIIAEYNPFHNGHRYQLEDAGKSTGADYTIVVMSGNFVQRGTPALLSKFKRAEMALRNGADLVLELPMYYAVSSAEYFATGAVSLLDRLNIVDNLCFGSECGDVNILREIAGILVQEPEGYITALRSGLKQGLSYPNARAQALVEHNPVLEKYQDIFSSPNNILGIEYLKALIRRNSSIQLYTTMRAGADYNEDQLSEKQASALAIRQAIFSDLSARKPTDNLKGFFENTPAIFTEDSVENANIIQKHMSTNAYNILSECLEKGTFLNCDDFSAVLHYKLLSEYENGFEKYLDVSPELSDRIIKNLYQFDSFTSFCNLLKSKDMTYTRISRCLLHILLDMTTATMESYRAMDFAPYARVLGFRKDATPLLTALKDNSSIPLVTKLADTEAILSPASLAMLKNDIHMNRIYESTMSLKSGQPMKNEYRTPIVIV